MTRKHHWHKVVLGLLILVFVPGLGEAFSKERFLSQVIHLSLERWHFSDRKIDDDFSLSSFDEYLRVLDYHKRFFLRSDIEAFARYQRFIDDELLQGTTRLMTLASQRLQERIQEVMDFTGDILARPCDFSLPEYLELERDKRDYAADKEALREHWRKLIKYQCMINYANLQASKKKPFEPAALEARARRAVAKSYGSMFNQLLQAHQTDSLPLYLNALLQVYDPHSGYFPPKEKQDFDIEMTGQFEGIGALLREGEGFVEVVRIIPGGPSWRQKELEAGDLILKVGQGEEEPVDIAGMRVVDAVKLIRGTKGTLVRLTVKKPDGRIVIIPIVRDVVIVEETFAKSAILKDGRVNRLYGYVFLPRFYRDFNNPGGRNATEDVRRAVDAFIAEDVAGIILDLRNNSGGSLSDAVDISGLFLPRGPIVQVKNKQNGVKVLRSSARKPLWRKPLVVLINTLSASASEILAAAMQDYGRAVIVGSAHSFGKGTVQIMLNLDQYLAALAEEQNIDDTDEVGALKLTVQKFYRITGSSSQFRGVVPDVVLPDRTHYLEIGERYLDHALDWDSIPALSYTPWSGQALDVKRLAAASAERIGENPYFRRLDIYVRKLEAMRKETRKSLRIEDYMGEQEQLRAEEKQVNEGRVPHDFISVSTPWDGGPAEEEGEGPRAAEREKIASDLQREWFDEIKKDAVLLEAMNVLFDMIGSAVD